MISVLESQNLQLEKVYPATPTPGKISKPIGGK